MLRRKAGLTKTSTRPNATVGASGCFWVLFGWMTVLIQGQLLRLPTLSSGVMERKNRSISQRNGSRGLAEDLRPQGWRIASPRCR